MSTTIEKFRLLSMPSAQCHVNIAVRDGQLMFVDLVSYSTRVLTIAPDDDDKWVLSCSGTYSVTTARHINRFTQEFCGKNLYHECKHAMSGFVIDGWADVAQVDPGILMERAYGYLENTLMHSVRKYNGHY